VKTGGRENDRLVDFGTPHELVDIRLQGRGWLVACKIQEVDPLDAPPAQHTTTFIHFLKARSTGQISRKVAIISMEFRTCPKALWCVAYNASA